MKLLNILGYAVLVGVLLAIVAWMHVVKVEVGQTGVLTEEWGKGLIQKDFPPGYHLDLGPLHSWVKFDTTVQTLSMTKHDAEGALQIKSADGANVTMDVTVKYQIKPGECWILRKELGIGDSYKIKVRNEAIDALRPVFGAMITEDFYNPNLREAKAKEAARVLSQRLSGLHVNLVQILVRDLSFEKAYEDQIKGKALAQQDVEVNRAQREAAKFAGDTKKIEAETEAKVLVIKSQLEKDKRSLTADNEKAIESLTADGAKYVTEQKADADLYAAQKQALADLLIKNAEAKGQELRQKALQGSGASNLIALEAARNLKFDRIVLSTLDNNILDIVDLARKLGAK